eukprot:420056_1
MCMKASQLFWLVLLSFIESNGSTILCNYIYDIDATRAYPTDVCMKYGFNSFVKYQCVESLSYFSNYTIIMKTFSNADCTTDTIIQEFDLNEWIKMTNDQNNNTNIQITYNCGGIDNCFIKYHDICVNSENNNNNNIYYPINQCLNDRNKSISFKYECD